MFREIGVETILGDPCSVSVMECMGALSVREEDSRSMPELYINRSRGNLMKGLILLIPGAARPRRGHFSLCLRFDDCDIEKKKNRTPILCLCCLLHKSVLHAAVFKGLRLWFLFVSCCHCKQMTAN